MRIYFLKCLTSTFHNCKELQEFLYIGKDSTGRRIDQHHRQIHLNTKPLYKYLGRAKENKDYVWEFFDNVKNHKELDAWEKFFIFKHKPIFNVYLMFSNDKIFGKDSKIEIKQSKENPSILEITHEK